MYIYLFFIFSGYILFEFINYIKYKKLLQIIKVPHYQPTRNSTELLQSITHQKKMYQHFSINSNKLIEQKSKEHGYLFATDHVYNMFKFDISQKNDVSVKTNIEYMIKNDFYGDIDISTTDKNENSMLYGKMNIDCIYRPLFIDIGIQCFQKMVTFVYNYKGYKTHYVSNGEYMQKYYCFYNPYATKTIIFIHGIGFGSSMYINFILRMNKEKYSIIIVELYGLGTPFTHTTIGNFTNFTYTILRILKKHALHKNEIILLGHSLGTNFISAVNNINNTHKLFNVSYIILLEPVCFLHHMTRATFSMYCSFNEFKTLLPYNSCIDKIYTLLLYYYIVRNISIQFINKRMLSSMTDIVFRDTKTICFVYFGLNDNFISAKTIESSINNDTFPNVTKFVMNEEHGSFLYKKEVSIKLINKINIFIESKSKTQ